MKFDSRTVRRFAIRWAIVFVLLIFPWPQFSNAFCHGFQSACRVLLAVTMPGSTVLVENNTGWKRVSCDTQITIRPRHENRPGSGEVAAKPEKIVVLDSRSLGWMPIAMILALVGATPFPRSGRIFALMSGLFAVLIFVGISVWVSVNVAAPGTAAIGWRDLFFFYADHLLIQNLWLSFLFPTLVWSALFARALCAEQAGLMAKRMSS
jgi:hypothetical protein